MKLMNRLLDTLAASLADRIHDLNEERAVKIAESVAEEAIDQHERHADHLGGSDVESAVEDVITALEREGKLLDQDAIDEAIEEERKVTHDKLLVLARAIQSLIPVEQVEANDALHKLIAELQ